MSGISAACAAVEGMTRSLAAEFAPLGIRVLCLRPGGMLETRTIKETVEENAKTAGMPLEVFYDLIKQGALMKRAVTLEETAKVAAFLVSDLAGCMTGQVINASCGLVLH